MFGCVSTLCTPVDFASNVKYPFDHPTFESPRRCIFIYIDYQFDNEGMEIFIATIFTSTRFDPEIVVLGGKMAEG